MILITNNNESYPLVNFSNLVINKDLTGDFNLSLVSFSREIDNRAYDLLIENSIIDIEGYKFRVITVIENKVSKRIDAVSTFFDNTYVYRTEQSSANRTFTEFCNFLFNGTEWTFQTDITDSLVIENFGNDNVTALTLQLCRSFNCNYEIMPNNIIRFSRNIGPNNDFQYRYGYNVAALNRQVDISNVRTRITGYGGNGLIVTYDSPNISVFGVREAEPIRDERFTIADNIRAALVDALDDTPRISLELDTIELISTSIGERVWLIYEPLNIDIQTEVINQKLTVRNDSLVVTSVTLGNAKPESLTDRVVNSYVNNKQESKEFRSAIEQTDDRINLEVEQIGQSIAQLELTAGQITARVADTEDNIGQLQITSTQVQASVTDLRNDTQASLTIQADQISQRVTRTEYTGETITSLINQTPDNIRIQARNVDLVGAVTVLSDITGNLGTITTGNINIQEDIRVGNTINVGSPNEMANKGIIFNSTANIRVNGQNLNISGSSLFMDSAQFRSNALQPTFDNQISINGRYPVLSLEPNLQLTRNTANPTLIAVSQNGAFIGNLQLT